MNNRYGDNRYGEDRYRDRYSSERGYDRGRDDRGFFDRAGDEVRSWFGDEEAEHRREADERRWEREQAMRDRQDQRYGGAAGRWRNQTGESWNRDRPGARSNMSGYDREQGYEPGEPGFGRAAETWGGGGSGFGSAGPGDDGRRFDRVDVGSTGTHGAHPMSAPVGGSAYGGGYGISAGGSAGSSGYAATRGRGHDLHDPHYSEWRNRQIEEIDRDYDEYRREHQSKFEQDFGNWRSKRGEQRQSMRKVTEHMEVVGSDGEAIGTVDCVKGDRILLTKNDENAGGHHHSIPCSWIESVDDKVMVNKSRDEAMTAWRDEDRSRALFAREDSGSTGPHMLNRSFSGTY